MNSSTIAALNEVFRPHRLVEQAPYGIIVHQGGKLLYANAEVARLLGYGTPSEMLDFSYVDFLSVGYQDAVTKDGEVLRKGEGPLKPQERSFVRKDGSVLSAEVLARVIDLNGESAIQVGIVDITDRKARQFRMEEADTLNRMLIGSTQGGVVLQDLNHRILAINPAAERVLGISADLALGQAIDILANGFDEAGRPLLGSSSPVNSVLLTGKPARSQTVQLESETGSRWLWFSAQPLTREGEIEPYAVLSSFEDITELRDAQAKLYYSANHDELTGLPNRNSMQRELEQALHGARRDDEPLAVLYLDLDRFKNVNDSYGHAVGDQLIQEVSRRVSLMVRDADWVGRPGGDEFVIILPDTNREQALTVVSRLTASMAQPFQVGETEFYTGVSLGIALYTPGDDTSAEELLKAADTAMYCAKGDGQTSYRFFEMSMLAAAHERAWLENNLRRGVEEGQFLVYYQPKANVHTGRLSGVEALVRWNHPERGVIAPDSFIPFAEESGLIVPLGRWVLQEACRQAKAWHTAGFDIPVAVNVAARQLKDVSLLQDIQDILDATGLPPNLLELELTESALVTNEEAAVETLESIRTMGIKLYIDDFGTGYSSLSQIATFSLDALKIDLSFTAKITTENKINNLVRAIMSLAKSLNLKVVAEGVETAAQLDCLRNLGCDEIQGYLVSKPLTAEDLARNFALGAAGGAQAVGLHVQEA
jgi:diguanylate cyclase (GGDEF)-like protein/PAS domain S-box-containing protein